MGGGERRPPHDGGPAAGDDLVELRLLVTADLQRAWQRCSWLLVTETGRERTEVMREMVHDFLVKHGC